MNPVTTVWSSFLTSSSSPGSRSPPFHRATCWPSAIACGLVRRRSRGSRTRSTRASTDGSSPSCAGLGDRRAGDQGRRQRALALERHDDDARVLLRHLDVPSCSCTPRPRSAHSSAASHGRHLPAPLQRDAHEVTVVPLSPVVAEVGADVAGGRVLVDVRRLPVRRPRREMVEHHRRDRAGRDRHPVALRWEVGRWRAATSREDSEREQQGRRQTVDRSRPSQ